MKKISDIMIIALLAGAAVLAQAVDSNEVILEKAVEIPDIYLNYTPILDNYVSSKGTVDYAKLRRRRLDLLPFALDIENLDKKTYESFTDKEKISFWINVYNFSAISLVVQNYPLKSTAYSRLWWPADSVRQIQNFYDGSYFKIMGIEYTLDEIENDVLLKQFKDPRICFALCKATIESPPIRNQPYFAQNLDMQLAEQIKEYLKSGTAFEFDGDSKTLFLNEIFDNHSEYFINSYGEIKSFRAFEPKIQAAFNFIDKYGTKENIEIINRMSTENPVIFQKKNWRFYTKINDIQ